MSRKDAEFAAKREFGNVTLMEESGRAAWTWPTIESVAKDVQFAAREIRRSPGFAATAVLILSLGIAANVIVFGVLKALTLQPLPLPNVNQVTTFAPREGGYPGAAFPEVRDVRDANRIFSAVAAEQMEVFGLEADRVTRPAWGEEVSGQHFEVMGIQPALGRLLQRADDDHPGASEAVVLSFPAWKGIFGGDPNIVGKNVRINKHPYTIIGVTQDGFYGTQRFLQPDLFVPMANQASLDGVSWLEDRRQKVVFPIARIKDGIRLPQVQAELNAIALGTEKRYPNDEAGLKF